MNLLAKSLGQLAMLAVALFFFSCEDPSSIGIENPSPKFNLHYVDIPLSSSVILMDTLRTGNIAADLSRFMVGKYEDPEFGNVEAGFFTEYLPAGLSELTSSPVFNDTIILELSFDYYSYGATVASEQTISVYKLNEDINGSTIDKPIESSVGYWRKNSNSQVSYDPVPIATKSFMVDPAAFTDSLKENDQTPMTLEIPLPVEFGRQLFDEIVKYKAVTDNKDTKENEKILAENAFAVNFRDLFKGLAVKADVADKIVRFNPAQSLIKLYYGNSTASGKYLRYYFSMSGVPSFNQIISERSGQLAEVTLPGTEYLKENPNRFIQSGIGIFTKVDLTNFYNFADTIPAAIINQAEFIITGVAPSDFAPPSTLGFRVLKDNREIFYDKKIPQHVTDSIAYSGYLRIDVQGAIVAQADKALYFVNDQGSPSVLEYNSEKKSYGGYVTMLTQQLFRKGDDRSKFEGIVLYPLSPKASKSVNRVMFPSDSIKLRIHYTTPTNINF
jgi:hypothetical protein